MKNLRFSRLCAKSVVRIVVASVIPVALLAGVSGADSTTTPTVNPITLTAPSEPARRRRPSLYRHHGTHLQHPGDRLGL